MFKFIRDFSIKNHNRLCILKRYTSVTRNNSNSQTYNWLLLIPITTFGLGTWQIYRLQWKKQKIKDLETKSQAEPVSLPEDILEPKRKKEMEFRRVLVKGYFDHSHEIYLGPRSLNTQKNSNASFGIRPQSGFQVVTPFILENGERILVNRGWVPKDLKDPAKRSNGQITHMLELSGFVKRTEKRPQFTPEVKEKSSSWHYADIDKMSKMLNTMPLLIEADSNSTIEDGPIAGQTRVTLRNEHLQYIITWYSLSAATFYLFYQLRKRPGAMFRAGP